LYHRDSVIDRQGDTLAHDPRHHRGRVAATQEMVAKPCGGPRAVAAPQRGQPPAGDRAGALELVAVVARRAAECRLDEGRADTARPELGAQARRAVAACGARRNPVPGERFVVEVAARDQVGDDRVGNVGGRPAPAQTRSQVARGPGASGEEVGGREPRGPRVEDSARTARTRQDLLKKELPLEETGAGARSVARCSNDCSPVEKMPRTLRSKSSALVAASRAVS
jgi:hypothetical protein